MRFSEFKILLFQVFFEPLEIEDIKFNDNVCECLTYKFGEPIIVNNRLISTGVDDEILNRITMYENLFNEMKDGDNELLIPRSVEIPFRIDCGLSRSVGVPRSKVEGMSFYTIVPYKRLEFKRAEVMRITNCAKKIFQNKQFFSYSHFCVESGKHKSKPNLHIHCLCKFNKGQGKNFSRYLLKTWKSFFPEKKYNISYKEMKKGKLNTGIDRVPCNNLQIQEDKKVYLSNQNKGSHANFIDLKINEEFVV